jgi:uncharacterized protein (TIGR03663 family)
LSRPAWSLLRNPREALAWLALLLVAVASRLADLGARAMNHDESLHAFYSFQLLSSGSYRHDPAYHGPLLYYINAVVYALVGDSDSTARLAPALAGVGLIASLYLFRPHVGRLGTWLAALLVVLSPTLLYYSRQLWSDIYVAVMSVLWIYAAFRYLADRGRRWLVLVTMLMALSFLAKEVAFIFGAIIGIFFATHSATRVLLHRERWRESPAGDLAVLMLSLALPFTAPVAHLLLGWDPTDYATTQGVVRSAAVAGSLAGASAALAWLWFGRAGASPGALRRPGFADWVRLAALFWGLQILFFTAFLTNVRGGLASGVVGSLGYWFGQHPVARGGQPWFYYLLLAGLYEFLPLILGICGFVAVCRRRGARRNIENRSPFAENGEDVGVGSPRRVGTEPLLAFCAWWTAASWIAYAWAGEKMPWLLTHLVLPLCLLGGWWMARVLRAVEWRAVGWPGVLMLAGGTPALAWMVAGLILDPPPAGHHVAALAATARWILKALIATVLAAFAIKGFLAVGWATGRRVAFIGLVGLATILTTRVAARLAYVDYDLATELLVYAHGTPDIKTALTEIELLSKRTTGGYDLEVAYDDESAWPFIWYLRSYRNARFYGAEPTADAMNAPVIIVGPKNADKVWPFVARGYVKREYRLIWWPIQDYASATWSDAVRALFDPETRQRLWRFIVYRRLPGLDLAHWPHRRGFTMYVSRDVAQQVWNLMPPADDGLMGPPTPVPQFAWRPVAVHAGVYGGAPLRAPTAMAIAQDGARVIADSGNDRIVVLNRDGTLRFTFGSSCRLIHRPAVGCLDPDGGGPGAVGDGQFHEPWGIAVSSVGEIYVADTWNGRIQVFDASGGFRRRWGSFGQPTAGDPAGAPFTLYGPRGLAIDATDNVLVADTGNKRILRVSPNGQLLQVVGGAGRTAGRFSEPVGLAVGGPDASVYVADTWNKRIQKLDRTLEPVAQWAVPGWEGRGVINKPYVVVDKRGVIYASDPERSRILRFDAQGRLDAAITLGALGAMAASVPVGMAMDPASGDLLVADWANHRVLVFGADAAAR